MKTTATTSLRKQAAELNAIISRRNLYMAHPLGNRRVINCEVKDKRLTVEDLYSGERHDVASNQFSDGYGQLVKVAALLFLVAMISGCAGLNLEPEQQRTYRKLRQEYQRTNSFGAVKLPDQFVGRNESGIAAQATTGQAEVAR